MSNISLEKFLSNLLTSSPYFVGGAILSTPPPVSQKSTVNELESDQNKPKNVILVQKETNLQLAEATSIVDCACKSVIPYDHILVGSKKYMVTSVQERSIYGRCLDYVGAPGGIVIYKSAKLLLVVFYSGGFDKILPEEAAALIESFADNMPQ